MDGHGYVPLRQTGTRTGLHLAEGYAFSTPALQGLLGLKVSKGLPTFLFLNMKSSIGSRHLRNTLFFFETGSSCVEQAGLELEIPLPQPSKS